jgi:hypothetical protein
MLSEKKKNDLVEELRQLVDKDEFCISAYSIDRKTGIVKSLEFGQANADLKLHAASRMSGIVSEFVKGARLEILGYVKEIQEEAEKQE